MSSPYIGTWRIIQMEQWDKAYIDLVVPGYIAFREDHLGEFQFGTVHGDLDYRLAPYQETERLEFSWEGEDEMDPVSGLTITHNFCKLQERLKGQIVDNKKGAADNTL